MENHVDKNGGGDCSGLESRGIELVMIQAERAKWGARGRGGGRGGDDRQEVEKTTRTTKATRLWHSDHGRICMSPSLTLRRTEDDVTSHGTGVSIDDDCVCRTGTTRHQRPCNVIWLVFYCALSTEVRCLEE